MLNDLDEMKPGSEEIKFAVGAGKMAVRHLTGININEIISQAIKDNIPCCREFIGEKLAVWINKDLTPAVVQAINDTVVRQGDEVATTFRAIRGVFSFMTKHFKKA